MSWNGTWSGAWGGSQGQATSITIANKQVVTYTFSGNSNPVSSSVVTAKKVSYGENGVSVVMLRTGPKTASAKLHSSQGDATAILTRE
jgi:hypothetical protein